MDVLGTSFYFSIYDSFKHRYSQNIVATPAWVSIVGGALAGGLSWIIVFPIDVVKSLVQGNAFSVTPMKMSVLVSKRFKDYGLLGFYRGLSMQLIRAVPVHSLNFLVFEKILYYLDKKN